MQHDFYKESPNLTLNSISMVGLHQSLWMSVKEKPFVIINIDLMFQIYTFLYQIFRIKIKSYAFHMITFTTTLASKFDQKSFLLSKQICLFKDYI